MNITILCTNEKHPVNSWLYKWMADYNDIHHIKLVRKGIDLGTGDILFLISCHEKINKKLEMDSNSPLFFMRAHFQLVEVCHLIYGKLLRGKMNSHSHC